MKRMLAYTILIGLAFVFEADAAAQNTAPYATGKLCWTWQKGAPPFDVQADHLNIRCGTAPGLRDLPVKPIAVPTPASNPPEYCINIRDVIPPPQTFPISRVCASTAALGSQESKESIEFPFVAMGSELAPPTNGRLVP